ncbi:MAG: response regulator transcription factor [Nitrospira sp.]|nr:response regulator transcription factor [Nitrospira sp.]MDH4371622.1 response regulator transcription factor [Nitrospira sp.]MDH5723850.1 response regulator transcription factor [Nitrospira sp.]
MNESTRQQHTVRVLLVDESMLTLQGLKTMLAKRSHVEVVGIATTSGEVLTAIQTHRPDVVILEVHVGRTSGIDLCKMIRETHPRIGILFFTSHDDKDMLRAAILAGAQGYLLKTAAADAVARSIEIVATGRAIMDQQLTQQVIAWVRDRGRVAQERVEDNGSKEDLRLLSYIACGKTNKEIAQELNVAPTVVATRLRKIYKHLRISRRSEAARYYVRIEEGLDP